MVLTCQLEEPRLEELKRLALSAGITLTIWSIRELDILTPSGKPQQAAQV